MIFFLNFQTCCMSGCTTDCSRKRWDGPQVNWRAVAWITSRVTRSCWRAGQWLVRCPARGGVEKSGVLEHKSGYISEMR